MLIPNVKTTHTKRLRVSSHYYKYDITDLGLELFDRVEKPAEKARQSKV